MDSIIVSISKLMEIFLPQGSSYASDIDFVIVLIAILGGFWLLAAEGMLFYLMLKYRRKNNPKASYITGDEKDLLKWIHWPHNIIILCDVVIIIFAVMTWYKVKQDLPEADATVRIVGQQWSWKFQHPGPDGKLDTDDDIHTVDELHLQVGKTYHYKLESDDVLHSFSVPVFRLKQDAVPGRTITGWFKPTKAGKFDIQCAEMCGIGHGIMMSTLYVESGSTHSSWMKKMTGSLADASVDKDDELANK